METTTAKEVLFMGPWALPGSNAGGSPGVNGWGRNFSDVSNSIQAFGDFFKDIKDYSSGDKPVIEKRGPSLRPESKIDTTWDYFRNLWHTRAKYGDTLPVDSDPYNPNPNFKSNK